MEYSKKLAQRIIHNIMEDQTVDPEKYTRYPSAVVFKNIEDNFLSPSYEGIMQHSKWRERIRKVHSHFEDGTLEMQSANSSDALLMNVFCYPGMQKWSGLCNLLRIEPTAEIEFGWNPSFENEKKNHPTEIDMKIGDRIFESKLTEQSFTTKQKDIVEQYADFHKMFDAEALDNGRSEYSHYQLIRNILTAYKYDCSFSILIDETRIDLMKELFIVVQAIKDQEIRNRISFFTWQEISAVCGAELKEYLHRKYL